MGNDRTWIADAGAGQKGESTHQEVAAREKTLSEWWLDGACGDDKARSLSESETREKTLTEWWLEGACGDDKARSQSEWWLDDEADRTAAAQLPDRLFAPGSNECSIAVHSIDQSPDASWKVEPLVGEFVDDAGYRHRDATDRERSLATQASVALEAATGETEPEPEPLEAEALAAEIVAAGDLTFGERAAAVLSDSACFWGLVLGACVR